jgi:hypothetical protein
MAIADVTALEEHVSGARAFETRSLRGAGDLQAGKD